MAVSKNLIRVGCCACKFLQRQPLTRIPERGSAHKYTPVSTDFPNNRFTAVYRDLHGPNVEDPGAARDFIYALNPNERSLLYNELKSFEEHDNVNGGIKDVSPPTSAQLKKIALHNALPFIGFGFLDNFIMIMAGESIDATFGAVLGISTMAAAALGNLVSDVAGLGSAHYIEYACGKFGVRTPTLLPEQVDMKQTKWSANMGKTLGISLGCLLGMIPLLFLNNPRKKEEEDEAEDITAKSS